MKKEMNVLSLKKPLSRNSSNNLLRSQSLCGRVIKMEPEDELEKEGCDDEDYVTDLTLADRDGSNEEHFEQMSNDDNSENIKEEVFATEIMEEDEDEVENPELPVFSVIVKEENRDSATRDPLREKESYRSRVEIKYEDDIEEEEYDSDEESCDQSEMGSVNTSGREADGPLNFVNVNGRVMSNNVQNNIAYRSCFNPEYFDSSIVNFQVGSHVEKSNFEAALDNNGINGDSEDKNSDKSSNSILLSIVYATINVPFSQVSKFLTAYNLSKSELSVIRKVRRQVKNRLYAQNCRRRRVAHIKNLANELQQIKVEKEKLYSVRNELTVKMLDVNNRYKRLYTHVMNTLTERYRDEDFDFTDNNMNENAEQCRIQKRKLAEEYEELEIKKQKLEQKYDQLYTHIFQVIKIRHQKNGMSRNTMEGNIDLKLCRMDIVNELAMLNKYWSKNNLKTVEQMDFESSISVDGSRTSENKLSDFVDYESSISMDGSRTDENKLNDFIDYESSVDGSIQSENQIRNPARQTATVDDQGKIANRVEENSRMSENSNSMFVWTEEEEEGEEEDEEDSEEDEDDGFDDDLDERLDELDREKEELSDKKNACQQKYDKLYDHVLKALKINELEFVKIFMDYCIRLLKTPPEGSTNSVDFDGS